MQKPHVHQYQYHFLKLNEKLQLLHLLHQLLLVLYNLKVRGLQNRKGLRGIPLRSSLLRGYPNPSQPRIRLLPVQTEHGARPSQLCAEKSPVLPKSPNGASRVSLQLLLYLRYPFVAEHASFGPMPVRLW